VSSTFTYYVYIFGCLSRSLLLCFVIVRVKDEFVISMCIVSISKW